MDMNEDIKGQKLATTSGIIFLAVMVIGGMIIMFLGFFRNPETQEWVFNLKTVGGFILVTVLLSLCFLWVMRITENRKYVLWCKTSTRKEARKEASDVRLVAYSKIVKTEDGYEVYAAPTEYQIEQARKNGSD